MIVVALTLAGALGLTTLAWAGLLRVLIRAHARERDLLINQVLHLSGRTWTPPPAEPPFVPPDPVRDSYTLAPEQLPDGFLT